MKKRVISYIDGLNLYHAIDELNRPHLKWVDLWALSQSVVRPSETLVSVHYFSAYATWMPERHRRHITYVNALKAQGVSLHLANFKVKWRKCNNCGTTWKSREEKETDVSIAAHLVTDALLDRFDRAILITADSDIRAAVVMVAAEAPANMCLLQPHPVASVTPAI